MRLSKHRRQDASPTPIRGSPGILEPTGAEADIADTADGPPPLPPPSPPPNADESEEAKQWDAEMEAMNGE